MKTLQIAAKDVVRPPTAETIARATTAGATITNQPADTGDWWTITFDRDLTAAEEAKVRMWCQSSDAEMALQQSAMDAITANLAWLQEALPQIVGGADVIQARVQPAAPTNITQVNAVLSTLWTDVRNLSLAVESLANERARSIQIENALIKLGVGVLDGT